MPGAVSSQPFPFRRLLLTLLSVELLITGGRRMQYPRPIVGCCLAAAGAVLYVLILWQPAWFHRLTAATIDQQ